MRTRITLLAQPKSMRSTIDATRQEPRHGSAWNWGVNKDGVYLTPHSQPNPTPSPRSTLSEPQRPQQAHICITACQNKHVCSDAQACGRVVQMMCVVNIVGVKVGVN